MAKHKHNKAHSGSHTKAAHRDKHPRRAVLKPFLQSDYKRVRVGARQVLHSQRGLKSTAKAAHKLNRIETRLEGKDPNKMPLYNPSAPLTGKDLQTSAHKLAAGEFNPQIRALERQRRNQDAQYQAVQDRSDSYYNQMRGYQTMAQVGLQRQAGMSTLQSAQVGQATEDQLARARAAVTTPGNQAGGASRLLNQEAGLEQMRAAGDANAYTQATIARGQDWSGLNASIASTTALRGSEARQELVNRRLNADQATTAQEGDLRAQRGAKFTEQLLALRQQGFENQATAETLNLKGQAQTAALQQQSIDNKQRQQTIDETARRDTLSHHDRILLGRISHLDRQRQTALTHGDRVSAQRISARAQRLREQVFGAEQTHGSGPFHTPGTGSSSSHPRHGIGSLTQGQENTGLKDLNYAISVFRQFRGKRSGHTIRQLLTTGGSSSHHHSHSKQGVSGGRNSSSSVRSIDPLFINAAEDIVYRGGLSKTNLKRLHRAGYHTKNYKRLHGGGRGLNDALNSLGHNFHL